MLAKNIRIKIGFIEREIVCRQPGERMFAGTDRRIHADADIAADPSVATNEAVITDIALQPKTAKALEMSIAQLIQPFEVDAALNHGPCRRTHAEMSSRDFPKLIGIHLEKQLVEPCQSPRIDRPDRAGFECNHAQQTKNR